MKWIIIWSLVVVFFYPIFPITNSPKCIIFTKHTAILCMHVCALFSLFFVNFYSKHEYPKLKSTFDYYYYETSDTHTDSRNKQTPAFKCATHTYRNHKSVAFVIWTLSLTRFKYVTQLNHYNHWFIRHNRIVRSRVLAHISTNSYDFLHFTLSLSFPLSLAHFLSTPYILSVEYFAESYFRKVLHTLSLLCTMAMSFVWESANECEVWIA